MTIMLRGLLLLLAVGTVCAETPAPEVLVFGGTGRLGAPIVHKLVERGYAVTVFARPTSSRDRLSGLDVRYVIGDLLDGDSVESAIAGDDYAFVIDASARGASRESFYDTAMRHILASLEPAVVRQFILHGSVGAGDNMKNFPDVPFGRMEARLRLASSLRTDRSSSRRDCRIASRLRSPTRVMPLQNSASTDCVRKNIVLEGHIHDIHGGNLDLP